MASNPKYSFSEYDFLVSRVAEALRRYNSQKTTAAPTISSSTSTETFVKEAKEYLEQVDRNTKTKDEFLGTIDKHLEKLQQVSTIPSTTVSIEKAKSWFNSNRDSLQNILNKILRKHGSGSSDISALNSEVLGESTKEGLITLQQLLRLDPSQFIDDSSVVMDIYRVKKAIQSLRQDMNSAKKTHPESSQDSVEVAAPAARDGGNDTSDEDSFLFLFLCELTCAIQVSIKGAVGQHNLADKLQPELNRLLVALRQWFDAQPPDNRKNQATVIVQLVTAACDYEDGTVSPYRNFEELLLLLLPIAEDLKAVERSLLSRRRRDGVESASWKEIVKKRTAVEKSLSGNRGFIPITECPPVDYVSVWKDISDSFDKEIGNMCSHDVFLLPPLTFKTCLPFVFRSVQKTLPVSSPETESLSAQGNDFTTTFDGWTGVKAASVSVSSPVVTSAQGNDFTTSGWAGRKAASLSVASNRQVMSTFSKLEIAAAPGTANTFFRGGYSSPISRQLHSEGYSSSESSIKVPLVDPNAPYSFPRRPQILSRTHFEVLTSFFNNIPTTLIEHMNKIVLPKFDSYDFSDFDRDGGMWHGKYIRGATCCDVDVLVYADRKSDKCIIEVIKTKGDSKPYVQFFKDLKAQFVPQTEAPKQSTPLFNFGSLSCSMISDEDYLKGLQPVFRMALATNYEARFEAAKMLCDLFQQRQTQLQNDKVREACISCIETLVHDGFADVQQFAIMAMSLMAEVDQNYKMDLIKSSALLLVVKMVVDNPNPPTLNFETIQTRRECAKILMTLASDNNGPALKSSIIEKAGMGTAFLQDWMNQVRTLTDYRLKTQTAKAFPEMTLA